MGLDKIDKAILRLLVKYEEKELSTNQIAMKVEISPRTAKKHLDKLEEEGYVEFRKEGKERKYVRKKQKN